jgi:hypothetical protein
LKTRPGWIYVKPEKRKEAYQMAYKEAQEKAKAETKK